MSNNGKKDCDQFRMSRILEPANDDWRNEDIICAESIGGRCCGSDEGLTEKAAVSVVRVLLHVALCLDPEIDDILASVAMVDKRGMCGMAFGIWHLLIASWLYREVDACLECRCCSAGSSW